jgi:hypothetical protein
MAGPFRTRGGPDEKPLGRMFWLLACLLPAFTTGHPAIGLFWEVVSSYSSATASDFHGIPRIHGFGQNLAKNCAQKWGNPVPVSMRESPDLERFFP